MTKYDPHLLYRFALDFVVLNSIAKFNIGLEMKIVEDIDAFDKEDNIDLKIYRGAILNNRLPEFARRIYQANGGMREQS